MISVPFERTILWIVRSRWRTVGVSVAFGAVTFVTECIVHLLVIGTQELASASIDALILGSLSAIFTILVLTAARDRHRRVQDDLRRIAELNHRIRNALQEIVYGEASRVDCHGRMAVLQGVEKIDSTLKEIFPLIGERRDDRPWEKYNRAQLERRNIKLPVKDRRKTVS
ncbi:MAG TPA: hypothetical protein VF786_03780 [Terriglobales bacterium]